MMTSRTCPKCHTGKMYTIGGGCNYRCELCGHTYYEAPPRVRVSHGASGFQDVAADAPYAQAAAWAVREGVTSGTGANDFSPDSPCTRGQIVTFLYRALAG